MKNPLTLLLLFLNLTLIAPEEILILLPFSPKTHKAVFDPLASTLGSRGHAVTVASTFGSDERHSPVNENVTEVVLTQFRKQTLQIKEITVKYGWFSNVFSRYYSVHKEQCRQLYDSEVFKSWTSKNSKKFKLVLIDFAFSECLLPLWRKFADNVIIVSASPISPAVVDIMTIPTPYSHVPYSTLSYTHRMSFGQRFVNAFYWIVSRALIYEAAATVYENVVLPNFPDMSMSYEESVKNISLILANEDLVFTRPRPYLANTVLVGGLKCRAAKPLEKGDLQKFIDESEDGFIFVNFDTITSGNPMGDQITSALITASTQIKQRIVWKRENFASKISNILTIDNYPQEDILGHPKIKAFINDGEMSNLHDGLYNSLPQISFGVTGDQPRLTAAAEDLGIGISLDYRSVTANQLVNAINKASFDADMRDKVNYYSRVFRGRRERPVDAAVYWIEFVMKFNGAPHLRSGAAELNFFQYFLIDVYALYFVIGVCIVSLYWLGVKKIVSVVYSRVRDTIMWKVKVQ